MNWNAFRKIMYSIDQRFARPRTAVWLQRSLRLSSKTPAQPLNRCQSILVVKPDEIGDVVLATPFLRELRRNCPEAHIVLVVKKELLSFMARCPHVNEVIAYDWNVDGRLPMMRRFLRIVAFARRRLWNRKFDLAILLRWDADHYQAGQLVALSGAKRRVGYSSSVAEWKRVMNDGLDRCFTDVLQQPVQQHEVLQNLEILRRLGGTVESDALELSLSCDAREWACDRLSHAGPVKKIALGMGARQAAKRWPLEHFREVTRLLGEGDFYFVLLGSTEDRHLGDWTASTSVLDRRGQATLEQSAALIEKCDLYLGNDTGLKHIAAALHKPVIEISCHPANGSDRAWPWPERFHAWGVPFVQLRPSQALSPCQDGCISAMAHCIAAVQPARVASAVRSMMVQQKAA